METQNSLDDLIRKAYDPMAAEIRAPKPVLLNARKIVETRRAGRSDLFTMLANFLNLKVKLAHAVIAFIVIWSTLLLFEKKEVTPSEDRTTHPHVAIAAVRNSTILSSCQTFVLKK